MKEGLTGGKLVVTGECAKHDCCGLNWDNTFICKPQAYMEKLTAYFTHKDELKKYLKN